MQHTLPALCKIVDLVLHCLSLEIMSFVTSTSKSSMLRKSDPNPMSSCLIVVIFFARRFALIAAIFSTDKASDNDLKERKT